LLDATHLGHVLSHSAVLILDAGHTATDNERIQVEKAFLSACQWTSTAFACRLAFWRVNPIRLDVSNWEFSPWHLPVSFDGSKQSSNPDA
jgi:hypothetical protein